MLENFANGVNPELALKEAQKTYEKLFREEREEYGNIVEDARIIFKGYLDHWKNDPIKYLAIKGIKAEHGFEIEIAPGIILVGKMDQVGKTKDKRMWLVEDKTFKQMPSDGFRMRDIQTAIYVAALNKTGMAEVDGILWNYVTNQPFSEPQLLKSGDLSKAKGIRTLPDLFLKSIRKHHLNPKDYTDTLKSIELGTKNFYRRVFVPINEELCDTLIEEAVITAEEIQERSATDATRNLGKDCDWCSYEGLCRAELMGMNTKFILRRDYAKKEVEIEEPSHND